MGYWQILKIFKDLTKQGVKELTSKEIAQITGRKENTVSQTLRRTYRMGFLTRKRRKQERGSILYAYALSKLGLRYKRDHLADREFKDLTLAYYVLRFGPPSEIRWVRRVVMRKLVGKSLGKQALMVYNIVAVLEENPSVKQYELDLVRLGMQDKIIDSFED